MQGHAAVQMSDPLREVEAYYESCLEAHGATSRGVNWADDKSHSLRFEVISDLARLSPEESILDVGCGFGSFLTFLRRTSFRGNYMGIDISKEMISTARRLFPHDKQCFVVNSDITTVTSHDVVVASGLFNVRAGTDPKIWREYVDRTLINLGKVTRSRLIVNFLSLHSDEDKRSADLYYESIGRVADLLSQHIGRHLSIRQDYGLFEFTICTKHV